MPRSTPASQAVRRRGRGACSAAVAAALCVLGGAQLAGADDAAALGRIEPEGALAKVRWLSDDAREGRAAGTDGGLAAARFIAQHLERLGLEPLGDPKAEGLARYFQPFEVKGRRCRNVVAMLPGRDPAAGYVLIGAHYDHLGRGQRGSLAFLSVGSQIHNGADDNASGTAAVMEIAEALGALGRAPRRAIVLCLFDAEELGLLGSGYLAAHPPRPLVECKAMLNLDMVGRGHDEVTVLGATSGAGLLDVVVEAASASGVRPRVAPYMVPNSDHFSFYQKQIPVAFFTTGLHGDYHRPSDDADKIEAETLAEVAATAARAALALADAPGPGPAFAEVEDAPVGSLVLEALHGLTGSSAFARAQALAFGPIAGASVHPSAAGLRVLYVERASPLASSGLRSGDVITEADGRQTAGTFGRLGFGWALRDGEADLVVQRAGQTIRLRCRPTAPGARPAPPRPAAPRGRHHVPPELF